MTTVTRNDKTSTQPARTQFRKGKRRSTGGCALCGVAAAKSGEAPVAARAGDAGSVVVGPLDPTGRDGDAGEVGGWTAGPGGGGADGSGGEAVADEGRDTVGRAAGQLIAAAGVGVESAA